MVFLSGQSTQRRVGCTLHSRFFYLNTETRRHGEHTNTCATVAPLAPLAPLAPVAPLARLAPLAPCRTCRPWAVRRPAPKAQREKHTTEITRPAEPVVLLFPVVCFSRHGRFAATRSTLPVCASVLT